MSPSCFRRAGVPFTAVNTQSRARKVMLELARRRPHVAEPGPANASYPSVERIRLLTPNADDRGGCDATAAPSHGDRRVHSDRIREFRKSVKRTFPVTSALERRMPSRGTF